jgi:hypothetical protein
MFIKKLLLMICLMASVHELYAQHAIAISSNPGPGLHIAINWSPVPNALAYNIFRKNDGDPNYPVTPINTIPVKPEGNCLTIRSMLIRFLDSTYWKMVAIGLADSVLFNPCMMNTVSKKPEKYNRLLILSRGNMPIAIAAGLGYEDKTVLMDKGYFYKIVALNAINQPIATVANDLHVVAGVIVPIAPPTGIIAEPGDAMIQIRWNHVDAAAGYFAERALTPGGVFQRVNESKFTSLVKNHLNGDTLIPAAEGFIDFQRYNDITGKAASHLVNLVSINGPVNGTTYYYRIRSLDLFNRQGIPSVVSNAITPQDKTKPAAPADLATSVDDIAGKINIRWTQVARDIHGHWEYPDSSVRYKVYRFTSSEDPTSNPSVLVAEVNPIRGLLSIDATDADPNLRAIFGNRTWWYRVRSIDNSGNESQWSPAVSAIVKDITAPGIVKNLAAKGFEDHISLKWQINTEPDLATYMIYRSLCHLGSWIDCNSADPNCREWVNYEPKLLQQNERESLASNNERTIPGAKPGLKLPCPCSGPFVFLGEITQDSVRRAIASGNFFFDDRTIPAGSPLCYAYWIKAKDSSGNLSGSFPIPLAGERSQIVCERLHDLTAPDPALISGLFAQADQIRVEWMGPPTQDTRAYHVYRAEGTNPAKEPEITAYQWVGGMTVELPPTLPKVLTSPYTAPGLATCDKISVQATPWMSEGFFEDKNIQPRHTYWYRVAGIDYDGNETKLDKAAPISTFSFTKKTIPAPSLDVLTKQPDLCAVLLHWSPAFDPANQLGFIVYRSNSASGVFTPIVVSPLPSNKFTDNGVVRGVTYWYKIGLLMKNGRLSELTAAQSITP